MRKANGTRTPKQNAGKQTATISKTNSVAFLESPTATKQNFDNNSEQHGSQPSMDEEDLMGGNGRGSRSDVMDKNLLQMFDVLRHRLGTLKEAAVTRAKLCEEDTNKNSDRMSEQAPKIIDEFDEVIPRSIRDIKMPTLAHKDNLVSSDTIYIDPYHLVFSKTKVPTEAAKNLESMLEESFGNINMRETKNKKNKTANQTEKSKKSEQLKNEAKRINRMKFEKKLQQNMESFVTRSVMDNELRFEAPIMVDADADWPVTVKWCAKDPRSRLTENNEGEFNPDLLLRYAIERITLPSGQRLFAYLVRQPMIQRYFVSLFWLIKVKFFESENVEDSECYLLRLLSIDYRRIVEMLAARAHAEHEKDFAFKYLPFILTNAIYFGFFYVFPGSRHIYTKGFKKTIYMQVIQIMHGIQLCPSSVKVAWAKVFPEDTHEDGDGETAEDGGGESFPVLIALKGPKNTKVLSMNASGSDDDESTVSLNSHAKSQLNVQQSVVQRKQSQFQAGSTTFSVQSEKTPEDDSEKADVIEDPEELNDMFDAPPGFTNARYTAPHEMYSHSEESRFHRPSMARGHIKGGFLSDMSPEFDSRSAPKITPTSYCPPRAPVITASPSANLLHSDTLIRKLTKRGSSSQIEKSVLLTAQSLARMALNKPAPAPLPVQHLVRSLTEAKSLPVLGKLPLDTNSSSSINLKTMKEGIAERVSSPDTRATSTAPSFYMNPAGTKVANKHTVHGLMTDPIMQSNLNRTYLKPLAEKPHRQKTLVQRQNVHEAMNAHDESPQMQLYLSDTAGTKPQAHSHVQAFHRTIPIQWCAAGGADTHRKVTISTDLHNEISAKLRKSEQDQLQSKMEYHKEKIRAVLDTKSALGKVLKSGPTNISRFSLDLIRRQRNNTKEVPVAAVDDVVTTETTQQLLFYTDEELEKLLNDI